MPTKNNKKEHSSYIPIFLRVGLAVVLLFAMVGVASADLQTVIFQPTDEDFLNPERGFEKDSLDWPQPSKNYDYVRSSGFSLVRVYIRLDNYRESDIPDWFLSDLNQSFERIREAEIKVIIRFSYNFGPIGAEDASKARILSHLDQLKPVLENNADVIAVMQAGFIGAWGEWHSSTHGLDNTEDRRDILFKILDTLPPERMVQVRYPPHKLEIFGGGTLDASSAFKGSRLARTGYMDDCFLASPWEIGFWEPDYLNKETQFVPMGGETCRVSDYTHCSNALAALERLHWSYLNEGYHPDVLSIFESEGCMDEIRRRLGYRFVLSKLNVSEKVSPGDIMEFHLELENEGYASPYNERPVFLVLKETSTGHLRTIQLPLQSADPRWWLPGGTIHLDANIPIPPDLPRGAYSLFLWLPDATENLRDLPEYAIRMANENVWQPEEGFNLLFDNLKVTEGNNLVGEWRFDEGSGTTAYDSSEYGNDGTLVNGHAWVDGKVDKALSFDGMDDYVNCGNNSSLDITDEITIIAWVYPTASSYDQWDAILGKGNSAYRLHMHDNQFDFGLSIVELPNQNLDAGGVFAQNQWAHVAATYNGTNMKIYINGALANSTAVSGAIKTNNYHLWIGGRSEAPKYFKGVIDEVKIYNRALSAEEIREDYEVGLENTTPPASISNLQNTAGTTWINWTWTNPPDNDFNHTMVYLDGVLQTNTSDNYYNATGLIADMSYEIGTHTVDINGNVNNTWVNQTTTTTAASPDTSPPLVTNPSATPATIILNDNSRPRAPGTNISQLNVTVIDDTEVDTVTIDLSPIGGSAEAQMSKIPGTDIWSVTMNATAGINLTHNLIVTATDIYGNSNTSVSIQLTVRRRGDVFRDNVVDTKDAAYIARYLAGSEPEVPNLVLVGDVVGKNGDPTGDGVVDMKDAAYIARYEAGFEDVP